MKNIIKSREVLRKVWRVWGEGPQAKVIRILYSVLLYVIVGVMVLFAVGGILEMVKPLQKILLGVPVAFVFLVVNTCCAAYGARKIIGKMRKAMS